MKMRFQTKLILLMGSIALFVLLCVLGMTLLHLKYTTDTVRELGTRYAVNALKLRASYTPSVFRSLIESDFHRLAWADLPASDAETFPKRIDMVAFAPKADTIRFVSCLMPGRTFTAEELAALNQKFAAADLHDTHIGDTHFLPLDGEIWVHTARQNGWYFLRFSKAMLQEQIYDNTLTHCILTDKEGNILLDTGSGMEVPEELMQLKKMSASRKNEIFCHETPRWICVVVTLDFPEIGMKDITLFRFYDIITSSPDITEEIDGNLAEFYGFFVLLMGVSALALLIPMILFVRRITAPVAKAAEFANTLADGEFPEPLPPDTSGIVEAANLYQSLNWMRMRLSTMFEKLQRSHRREQLERQQLENASEQKSGFILAMADHLGRIIGKDRQNPLAAELRRCEDLLRDLAELDNENELEPVLLETYPFFRNEAAPFADKLEFRYSSDMPRRILADPEKLHDLLCRILEPVMKCAVHRIVMTLTADEEWIYFRLEGRSGNRALCDYLNHADGSLPENAAEDVILLTLAKQTARLLGAEFEIICRDDGTYKVEITFPREEQNR